MEIYLLKESLISIPAETNLNRRFQYIDFLIYLAYNVYVKHL